MEEPVVGKGPAFIHLDRHKGLCFSTFEIVSLLCGGCFAGREENMKTIHIHYSASSETPGIFCTSTCLLKKQPLDVIPFSFVNCCCY